MSDKYKVTLADLGEFKEGKPVPIKEIEMELEFIPYMWEEGNYACDCNRYRFFYDCDDEFPCGEGRFLLLRAETETHFYVPDPHEYGLIDIKKEPKDGVGV